MIKTAIKRALASRGLEIRRKSNATTFIPYKNSYNLQYGDDQICSFDFWLCNRAASQWYDEWFWKADNPVWELQAFSSIVKQGDRVLEIGAHHGFLTMMLAHLVGPSGKVVAVEANPENAIAALANVSANNLRNVEVVFGAGGERVGTAEFEFRTNSHQVATPSENTFTTPLMTADALAAKYGDFDVLKIDVEGFECEVLRGAKKLLEHRPALILELHPDQMREHAAKGSIDEFLSLIHAEEYEGTIVCRPDFASAIAFTPLNVPRDRVSNIHLGRRHKESVEGS